MCVFCAVCVCVCMELDSPKASIKDEKSRDGEVEDGKERSSENWQAVYKSVCVYVCVSGVRFSQGINRNSGMNRKK